MSIVGSCKCRAVTASEGPGKLKIGTARDDERFGNYTYRHEVVDGITYPPGQTKEKIDLMRYGCTMDRLNSMVRVWRACAISRLSYGRDSQDRS